MRLHHIYRCTLLALVLQLPLTASAATIAEAQSLLRQGQSAKALDTLNEVIASNPKDRPSRFLKGVALTELNRLDEATQVFLKLTEEAPELPEPYNNLAVIYAQQKQYDKARTALEMSIRTHPTYATAHENLGDLYTQMARQAYDKALQIDATNPSTQSKLRLLRDLLANNTRTAPSNTTVAVATPKPAVTPTVASGTLTPSASAPVPASNTSKASPVVVAQSSSARSSEASKPVEKPVEKPTEKPVEKPSVNPAIAEVERTINTWAMSWARKDVKAYLATYGKSFDVPDGLTRKAWENERQARIDKPGKIHVGVSKLKIDIEGNEAIARFRQAYSSQTLDTATNKTLILSKQGGRWLIVKERVGR